jgi:alpha-L-fucosidase
MGWFCLAQAVAVSYWSFSTSKFRLNTFNETEWSDGTLPVSSYNPDQLDCDQWVKTDIVGEVAKACKKYGLELGLYYSLWDRHEPSHNSWVYHTGRFLYQEIFH